MRSRVFGEAGGALYAFFMPVSGHSVNVMNLPQQFRILLVDDEVAFRKVIRASLAVSGFSVEEAGTGKDALIAVQVHPFDIVLLDVSMPGMSGVEACREIRELAPRTGIVMITVRDSEEDKVIALEAGADDYITKPFQFRELVARLHAVLRRTRIRTAADTNSLEAGDLTIHMDRRQLFRAGEEIRLSPKEFDLLAFMMKHQGAPLTHVNLLRAVWGPDYSGELEYLRTYIRMLRKKIEADPARPKYILTEPWVGYRFRNPADSDQALPEFAD